MSKILRVRDNSYFYVTDEQAEKIFETLNDNPNVRLLKIITGQGYRYINPLSIVSILPGVGEDYRSNDELKAAQVKALNAASKSLSSSTSAGLIGA